MRSGGLALLHFLVWMVAPILYNEEKNDPSNYAEISSERTSTEVVGMGWTHLDDSPLGVGWTYFDSQTDLGCGWTYMECDSPNTKRGDSFAGRVPSMVIDNDKNEYFFLWRIISKTLIYWSSILYLC